MFKGGAVVADKDSDGLVILLDESEGCIGFEGGGATDGDGGSRFHGCTGFEVSRIRTKREQKTHIC